MSEGWTDISEGFGGITNEGWNGFIGDGGTQV